MAALILPHRWRQQPQGPNPFDPSNPLLRGLWGAVELGQSPFTYGIASGAPVITGTKPGYMPGATGRGFGATVGGGTSTDQVSFPGGVRPTFGAAGGAILSVHRAFSSGSGTTVGRICVMDDSWRLNMNGSLTSVQLVAGGTWSWAHPGDGGMHAMLVTWDGGSPATVKVWIDGRPVAVTVNTAAAVAATGTTAWYVGNRQTRDRSFDGVIASNRVWLRQLSDGESQAISENPWQIFAPLERRIWVPAAGGGTSFKPTWAANANTLIGA